MMIKKQAVLLAAALALSLSGCSKGQEEHESTDSRKDYESGEATSNSQARDDAKVLKFLLTPDAYVSDDKYSAVNDYLKKQGRDYEVEFTYLTDDLSSLYGLTSDELFSIIDDYISSNQVDIVCASGILTGNAVDVYDYLLDKGYLYCLDEYMNTKEGRSLYEAMPANKWESVKTDGSLYGVNGYPCALDTGVTYIVNKSIMDKYNITKEELEKPFPQLMEILTKVQEGEGEGFYPLYFMQNSLEYDSFNGWFCYDSKHTPGLGIYEETGEVEDIFNVPDVMEYYAGVYSALKSTEINTWLEGEGDSWNDEPNYDNYFLQVMYSVGPDFVSINSEIEDEEFRSGKVLTADDFCVVRPFGERCAIRTNISRTCVWKDSAYRDEALDFLTLIYTDKYLTNLFMFGTKYFIKDGYVVDEKGVDIDGTIQSWYYANSFISERVKCEPENKREVYEEIYSKAIISKAASMNVGNSLPNDVALSCSEVLENFIQDVYKGEGKSFESLKVVYEKKYKDAGGDYLKSELKKLIDAQK